MPIMISVERRRDYRRFYIGIVMILFIGIFIQAFPFAWMLSSSVKDSSEIFKLPPTLIPKTWHFETYTDLFQHVPFLKYVLNSLILCAGTIVINLFVSTTAAYTLSKLKPKYSRLIMLFFLATLMVPFEATLIPTYVMMTKFPIGQVNFINTFLALWLPFSAWGYVLYLMKTSFDRIPDDFVEAARIDGDSSLRIYLQIILPLAKPSLAANAIIILPLAMLPSADRWTATVGLYSMQFCRTTPWNEVMAAAVVTTIPPLVLYLLFQRYIIQGFASSGITG